MVDRDRAQLPPQVGTTELSVVVCAYGKETILVRCLAAIEESLRRIAHATEIVLVANALDKGILEQLARSVEGLRIITPPQNLGFAGGVHAGVAASSSRWVAVVNDDAVVEPSVFSELLAVGESDERIGSVAPLVVFEARPTIVNAAGLAVDRLGVAFELMLGQSAAAVEDRIDVFGATGATALYRRSMLEEIGGFDASYGSYYEDADVAWRARMRGWRCLVAARAVVRHMHSTSLGHASASKYYLVGRNRVRTLAKNATRRQLCRSGPLILVYDGSYVVYAALRYRTLQPLRGRLRGLAEWRSYRDMGAALRTPVPLVPAPGFRAALARDGMYRRA